MMRIASFIGGVLCGALLLFHVNSAWEERERARAQTIQDSVSVLKEDRERLLRVLGNVTYGMREQERRRVFVQVQDIAWATEVRPWNIWRHVYVDTLFCDTPIDLEAWERNLPCGSM